MLGHVKTYPGPQKSSDPRWLMLPNQLIAKSYQSGLLSILTSKMYMYTLWTNVAMGSTRTIAPVNTAAELL